MYSCRECGKILVSQRALTNHLRTKHPNSNNATKVFQCGHCSVAFTQTKNLLRHLRSQHNMNESHRCPACPTIFGSLTTLNEHEETVHLHQPLPITHSASATVEFTTQAFNSRFQIHRMKMEDSGFIDPFNCLVSFKNELLAFINSKLQVARSVRIGFSIAVRLMKPLLDETTEAYFNSNMARVSVEMTMDEFLGHVDQLMSQLNMFATGGSGWVVDRLSRLEIKTAQIASSPPGTYIETPPILRNLKKSLLNIVNKKDSFCFLYCIAAALFSFVGSPFRPKSHMKNIEKLNFDPKQMPMPLSGIRSFEMRNKCSINVYQLEDNKLINIYSSKNKKSRRRVDLLRLVNGKRSHYCLIKNFSNIIHHLSRSPKKREAGPKSRFCRNCYQPIAKQNMQRHLKFCETNVPLEIVMPGQGRVVEFVNWQKTQRCSFTVYADLEAINVPQSESGSDARSKTREIERQYPASYGAVLIDMRGEWFSFVVFKIFFWASNISFQLMVL